ncbi:MAG TPA: GNAT family N-acetyltransferase [Candidatus Krumholzibacteria bacterium]|nr:GNAT family N-acetyltransferase [Candidatus Krumholzibacteria bacterium]HPD72099.1 GNAT family N-acetyltransferase [Candidatus Krumholzibacteria bacterium]HRY40969.1 GNAT family N-acetyltransferase [Candidatus Krumholzibacteria bacterium]
MPVTVAPVRDKNDLASFLRVPHRIYGRNHPQYVHPLLAQTKAFLDKGKNPFFRHADAELWLARDGRIPVGRIAAAVDRIANDYNQEQVGYFGFYEAPNDPEVALALLEAARAWIAGQGMAVMRGPGCFTTNHEYLGLLIQGHERRPAIGMPWQPPYYLSQLEAFGLRKIKDLFAREFAAPGGRPPERISRFAERIASRREFTIRTFRMDRFWDEVDIVRGLYFDAWKDNWGFVPMDEVEFRHSARDMKSMVDPGFLLIAEIAGKPIGFAMTTQDFNEALRPLGGALLPFGWLKFLVAKRRIRGARTMLLGVKPEHRQKGVDVALIHETIRYAATRGIHRGECSWILEDNTAMNRSLEKYGATVKCVYRILERSV